MAEWREGRQADEERVRHTECSRTNARVYYGQTFIACKNMQRVCSVCRQPVIWEYDLFTVLFVDCLRREIMSNAQHSGSQVLYRHNTSITHPQSLSILWPDLTFLLNSSVFLNAITMKLQFNLTRWLQLCDNVLLFSYCLFKKAKLLHIWQVLPFCSWLDDWLL